ESCRRSAARAGTLPAPGLRHHARRASANGPGCKRRPDAARAFAHTASAGLPLPSGRPSELALIEYTLSSLVLFQGTRKARVTASLTGGNRANREIMNLR